MYTFYMKKIHRFIGDFNLNSDVLVIRDKERVNHMCNVLKLFEGERICLCDGSGNEADARIKSYKKDFIEIQIVSRYCNIVEPTSEVTLFIAILKNDHFELVVQKASEIGVSHIVPILTEHTVKQGVNIERLLKIATEAAELSGRGRIPTIRNSMPFNKAIEYTRTSSDLVYFFDTAGNAIQKDESKKKISLFVGPEGGWGDEERIIASDAGCVFISLGPRTLRGETAAIIASYLMCQ